MSKSRLIQLVLLGVSLGFTYTAFEDVILYWFEKSFYWPIMVIMLQAAAWAALAFAIFYFAAWGMWAVFNRVSRRLEGARR